MVERSLSATPFHWLALLSVHQVQLDLDAGLLAKLPVRLEGTFRPLGMTLRANTTPSPAARAFMDMLRRIAPTVPVKSRKPAPP